MKCRICNEDFDGRKWFRLCPQCYAATKANLETHEYRRRITEGKRLAAAVDARRKEARRAHRALKGPHDS